EGRRPRRAGNDLADGATQPGIAFPCGPGPALARGSLVDRGELGPGHQVLVAGETGHVDPDLGNEFLCCGDPDADNLIELGHLAGERGDRLLDPGTDR